MRAIRTLRRFVRDNHALAQVMFSREFAGFDPGLAERTAADMVRLFIVGRVRACLDAGIRLRIVSHAAPRALVLDGIVPNAAWSELGYTVYSWVLPTPR